MHLPDTLLSTPWLVASWLLWLGLLALAALRAPWRRLRDAHQQHVFLGAVVALLVLWSFQAGVRPGLGFHFLGTTVFSLMFGWPLALIGTALTATALAAAGQGAWAMLAADGLLLAALPVTLAHHIQRQVQRRLPRHVFIYIFLCGFLGAIVSAGLTVLALVAALTLGGAYPFARIAEEYLPFLPLYLFPEGLLNGMLTTVFVGLRPQWLCTFDEVRYLGRR
ncbi:MAG TPA: energy-coupling factor ABC transporter permease [Candidatus Competibacteraceae bacterium]|nr:energy-coupling factor ABC transporter permease [Candidatus Competibacteraceae bacterium]